MLLNFGARNFHCFKEGTEVSLELSANCPENISRGNKVSNLLCVKGKNSSGKTNLLKIMAFLKHFCCSSFSYKPDENISAYSFFLNDDPIDIFCDFLIDNVNYEYEVKFTKDSIINEKITRKVKRSSTIIERKGNDIVVCVDEFSDLKKYKYRKNVSLISTAIQYDSDSIKPLYTFFDSIITNINWAGKYDFSQDYEKISEHYHNHPEVLKAAIEVIKECDLGITDIVIRDLDNNEGEKVYFPIFHHDAEVENNCLTYHYQSLGTKTLYKTIPYYLFALHVGGILVMDEFDTDFHPHMLPKIISYFDNEHFNKKNAQMLFATHNTDVLEYMGKYRTVILEKESSECYAYRLDEISGDIIRNDRPLIPVYNSGKIGGVPKI